MKSLQFIRKRLADIFLLLGISSPSTESGTAAPADDAAPAADAPAAEDGQTAPADAEEAAQDEGGEPDRGPRELDAEGRLMLENIRKFASWEEEGGRPRLEEVQAAFAEAWPGHEDEVRKAVADGRALRALYDKAYRTAFTHGLNHLYVREILEKTEREFPWGLDKVKSQLNKGNCSRLRRIQSKENRRKGPRKPVQPRVAGRPAEMLKPGLKISRRSDAPIPEGLHGSDFRALEESASWTIVIDESGSDFGPDSVSSQSRRGRFVAIAVAEHNQPPPMPRGWHATECTNDTEIDAAFQSVLNAAVGVLGVTVDSLPSTPGERWMDGVALLIDWALRLLPIYSPTKLRVLVENRGDFTKGQEWGIVHRECMRRLARTFPKRAMYVDLEIRVIGKDGSPFIAYADAVAYTWARTCPESKERMKESRLVNTCLIEGKAEALLHAWDAFSQGVRLSGADWWGLLPGAAVPGALDGTLLDHIGEEARADVGVWERYLHETRNRMAEGAVELRRLALAAEWLDLFKPDENTIPPLMRMAWLVVNLANSNHLGEVESAWESELAELVPHLVDEAAPLVCHADLHLAVARTNRFDFAGARRALARWEEPHPAVPGLRYWGQVRSSLGQHAAFEGRNAEAAALFGEALKAFGNLSDPAERRRDCMQTACYFAIAAMDAGERPAAEIRSWVEAVTEPLPQAAAALAVSDDPARRYAHHLLLRWLVQCGDAESAESYLACRKDWAVGEGHPWPLIQIYRAILLHPQDPDGALALAMDAADCAFAAGQGHVVRLIGAACRTIAVQWGEAWPRAAEELDSLAASLPFAKKHIEHLRAAQSQMTSPLELLQAVLPFNFR